MPAEFRVDLPGLLSPAPALARQLQISAFSPGESQPWLPASRDSVLGVMGFRPDTTAQRGLEEGGGETPDLSCPCSECEIMRMPAQPGHRGVLSPGDAIGIVLAGPCDDGGGGGGCVCCCVRPGSEETEPEGGTAAACCPTASCNDGNPCTTNDLCANQQVPGCVCGFFCGVPINCDDANPCTDDFCSNGVCQHPPRNCSDGDPCTIDGCDALGCFNDPKDCDDGDVCTSDSCDGDTGQCQNPPRCADTVCCPDGDGYHCCQASGVACCPDHPHCCDTQQQCCGTSCCQANQSCCNGVCGTNGACCFLDTGDCFETTSLCCSDMGGSYRGDGIDCNAATCQPRCDNCSEIFTIIHECYHFDVPQGFPCGTSACIENIFDTASCQLYADQHGPSNCNTFAVSDEPEVIQNVRPAQCPPMTVDWFLIYSMFSGCEDCSWVTDYYVACTTGTCSGPLLEGPYFNGAKKECGCP